MAVEDALRKGLLSESEIFWRDRYEWLQRCGYLLRPRYSPNWVPSWQGTNRSRLQCEDGIYPGSTKVMDAVRERDGEMVAIKHYSRSTHPFESDIALFLSSPPLAENSRNHCCPILDVLDDPHDHDQRFLVMPLFRFYTDPKFVTVGESVEFFRQAFEGLQFIHSQHVAHRDISRLNVMMEWKPILPTQFHPQRPWKTRDLKRDVRPYTRTAHPVKYYFTDFGLSRRYGPDDTNSLEVPIMGGDKTVPEFQNDPHTPRNPFHTDVYYMGNLIRRDFLEVYTNFSFMEPLISRMVQDAPDKRPSMDEVVSELTQIASKLSWCKLRERLVERRDSSFMNLLKSAHYLSARAVPNLVTRRSPIPTPKA
ncbi:kinase-like domain-containing protein [Daedaleopsis nitida]|nr:kinase-like domain-containing protein [Daedaleopsis nitida]